MNKKAQTTIGQNLKDYLFAAILIVIMIMILFVVLGGIEGVSNFKSTCETYGGRFWEIQNVTCALGHKNCRYMCQLNDETFSMADLGGAFFWSYSQQMCVKDCEYENKLNPYSCVC